VKHKLELIGQRRERVRALTKAGHTAAEIAEILEVTERTVTRDRADLGISQPFDNEPMTAAEDARIRELLADGCSLAEAGRTVGRAGTTVWKHYRHLSNFDRKTFDSCRRLRKQLGL
jgi:DNA-binding CsgD family transcriptional regulator